MKRSVARIGILLVFLSTVAMSSQGILIKLAYAEGVSIIPLLTLRNMLAVLFFVVLVLWKHSASAFNAPKHSIFLSMVAGVFAYYLATFSSMKSLTFVEAGLERILFFTLPVFVMLFDSIVDHTLPSARRIIALLMTQVGIFLVVGGGGGSDILAGDIIGMVWAVSGAALFAVYVVLNHIKVHTMGSLVFLAYVALGGLVAAFFHFSFTDTIVSLKFSMMGYTMTALYALATVLALLLLSEGVRRLGGQKSSLITAVGPFLTVMLGYWVLEETLTILQMIGGVIVIGAVLMIERAAKEAVEIS